MLSSSVKLAADAITAEPLDSGDDSGRDNSSDKRGAFNVGGKKKKGKKKPKKTVFRNNFVKESDSA